MQKLFLDDERFPDQVTWTKLPRGGWSIVRSYEEFVAHIDDERFPDFISFDHDLGEGLSGFDCAKWLVDYCLDNGKKFPQYQVHSMNPVGREKIEQYIEWAKSKQEVLR